MRKLDYKTYLDKVLGGWTGKSAGGILGAPTEGYKRFNTIEMSDALFETNYPNDDLDLQVLWLDMVKKKGPAVRETDFGDHWKKHVDFPWGEYGIAGRNLKLGMYPPQSGEHNNWYWKTGMGSPIRSEIWGMLNPGMPDKAAFYAGMDSSVDHEGFSVEAERFLSACAAEAFFTGNFHDIFEHVMPLFEEESPFTELAWFIFELRQDCTYTNAIGKFKSRYGDADFTYAPQNVGFALLVLLFHEPHFDNLIEALHLGHDSDCVCATVGGIYGILSGYEKLDDRWKKLVGDELLLSPEIVNIQCPNTLSGLAEETCRAGLLFTDYFAGVEISGDTPEPFKVKPPRFNLNTGFEDYKPSHLDEWQKLILEYENLETDKHEVRIHLESEKLNFKNENLIISVPGLHVQPCELFFSAPDSVIQELVMPDPANLSQNLEFDIEISINGSVQTKQQRGIPYYGTWMILGPFIEENPDLVPMNPQYPDHGLASLPSCQYMNHDKVNLDTDFLDLTTVQEIADSGDWEAYPFQVELYNPKEGKMDLGQFYDGRGQKTLYLYTQIYTEEAKKIWTTMGCSAFIKVWINGIESFERREVTRSWPYDIALETDLNAGVNNILIKIDMPTDHIDFEFGFKEFVGKHPHQSHWDRSLVPFI